MPNRAELFNRFAAASGEKCYISKELSNFAPDGRYLQNLAADIDAVRTALHAKRVEAGVAASGALDDTQLP